MKKIIEKIRAALEALKDALTGFAVIVDEDMRFNEDGFWNEYWRRRNRKAERRSKK